jgi:rare lipoprotein A
LVLLTKSRGRAEHAGNQRRKVNVKKLVLVLVLSFLIGSLFGVVGAADVQARSLKRGAAPGNAADHRSQLAGGHSTSGQRLGRTRATTSLRSGIASIYSGTRAEGGSRTANGERVRHTALTAAHKTLPFGTLVRVTYRRNGHSVVVRINDRGPFARGRAIDVTPAAARALGFSGITAVSLSLIGTPDGR